MAYVQNGWPNRLPVEDGSELLPYFRRRFSISVCNNVLIFHSECHRVIVPLKLRRRVLALLHLGHWGLTRMKQMSRRYCWWPGIDMDINKTVEQCSACQSNASHNIQVGLKQKRYGSGSTHFCSSHAIKHLTSAPFNPKSNGAAERMVRTFKTALSKILEDVPQCEEALAVFLETYRSTPDENGISPAERLHGRPHRTILSAMFPKPTHKNNKIAPNGKYLISEPIYIRQYLQKPEWIEAVVRKILGRRMYLVESKPDTSSQEPKCSKES